MTIPKKPMYQWFCIILIFLHVNSYVPPVTTYVCELKIKEKSLLKKNFKTPKATKIWYTGLISSIKIFIVTEIRSRLPNFGHSYFFLKKGTRDPKTIFLMVWVPSTKVHARVVLGKHVRQKIFSHW